MKFFRFIGKEEFDLLMNGEMIVPLKNSSKGNTSLSGEHLYFFECFGLDEKGSKLKIEYHYEFSVGVVGDYAVVVIDKENYNEDGFGTYSDPNGDCLDTINVDEFGIESYSLENVISIYKIEYYKMVEYKII